MFYRETLNRQVDENNSVWDLRDFCKNLMKANPNALELLFSVEQEYFDEELKELLDFVRENAGALVRVHWKEFSKAVFGVAWNGVKRNGENPKTVSRLVYFWLLWNKLCNDNECGNNGEMTEKTWRDPKQEWPRQVRSHTELTEEDKFDLFYVGHDWNPDDFPAKVLPGDEEKCKEVEQRFKTYFANYLTNH